MATRTVDVYPSGGAWIVVKDRERPASFETKREAVHVAVRQTKRNNSGQIVIHGRNGRIAELRTYGLPKVQNPPKSGALGSKKIAKAVGKVVRDRLAEPPPNRAVKSEK